MCNQQEPTNKTFLGWITLVYIMLAEKSIAAIYNTPSQTKVQINVTVLANTTWFMIIKPFDLVLVQSQNSLRPHARMGIRENVNNFFNVNAGKYAKENKLTDTDWLNMKTFDIFN